MLDVIGQWVAHYGYLLVAVFLFIEATGVPVPGETALVTAAALAGRGALSVVGVVIAGTIGTILGGHAGYWIGLRGGRPFVERHGKWIRLTPERLEKTHRFFERHGAKTVMLGRFVAFVRSFVGIFAGISGMPLRQFTPYNALGGSLWVVVFSLLGYAFGRNLPRLVHYIGRVSLLLATLIAVVVVIVFLWRWFKRNRVEVVASVEQRLERVTESPRLAEMRTRHPVAGRLLFGHYAHGEYLALHLFTGFLLSLAVIGIFGSITEGVIDTSPLTRFDVAIAARLNQSAPEAMLRAFAVLSSLGGRGAMTVLLFAGALHYAVRRRGLELAGWCAAFIGGSLLDAMLKFVVRRSELPFADVLLIDWGSGLASGHVLGVVVGVGMLAYLALSLTRRASVQTVIVVLAVALVTAITISRLYLGQAYVSDASAGLAAGLLWLASCVSAMEIVRQNRGELVLAPESS